MNLRGSRNERIHRTDSPAACLTAGDQPAPLICDGSIDSDDARVEPQRQLAAEPFIELLAPRTSGQALDAAAQFRECNDAEEDVVLVDLSKPADDACIGPRLRPLGNDVRIEQEAHSSELRSRSLERRTFSPEP